jgi:hypothetical protein
MNRECCVSPVDVSLARRCRPGLLWWRLLQRRRLFELCHELRLQLR